MAEVVRTTITWPIWNLQADVVSVSSDPTKSALVVANPDWSSIFQWLTIPEHDTRDLWYTNWDLTTVTYKLLGVTVATKTLVYTDWTLSSVTIL